MSTDETKKEEVKEVAPETEVKAEAKVEAPAVKEEVKSEAPEQKDQPKVDVAAPLSAEEAQKNAAEEARKAMRVIQIVQHVQGQRIEVHPIQNVKYRSDIIGILTQALNNIQNEDIMRNEASLIRESIAIMEKKLVGVKAPDKAVEKDS